MDTIKRNISATTGILMRRRNFLKLGAGSLISAPAILPGRTFARPRAASPIAVAHHPAASLLQATPTTYEDRYLVDVVERFAVDDGIVGEMVDLAIMKIARKETVAGAWESLFPAGQLDRNTRIAIKINHSYGVGPEDMNLNGGWLLKPCPIGPKPAVVDGVVDGLCQMLDGTFPLENIVVFDATAWLGSTKMAVQGFPASSSFHSYDVPATEANPRYVLYDRNQTPHDAPSFEAGVKGNYVTQRIVPMFYESDFVINIGVPKVHQAAGLTGCFKNMYGCTHYCMDTHGSGIDSGAPGVTNCIPTFYQALNEVSPTVINIYDALAGIYDGSAAHYGRYFQPNVIAAAHDPVALDSYGLHLVNEARTANGLHALADHDTGERTDTPTGPWSLWPGSYNEDNYINADFLTIAAQELSLGNLGYSLEPTREVGVARPSTEAPRSRLDRIMRSPGGWRIVVSTDNSGRLHTVHSRIVDLKGAEVKSFRTVRTRSLRTAVAWDGRGNSGVRVPAGLYSWEIRVDGRLRARTVALP